VFENPIKDFDEGKIDENPKKRKQNETVASAAPAPTMKTEQVSAFDAAPMDKALTVVILTLLIHLYMCCRVWSSSMANG